MNAIIDFVAFVLNAILTLAFWLVILFALMSTLISFEIINTRNRYVAMIWRTLDSVITPVLSPIRRVLPRTGALDFSAFILLVLIIGVQNFLLPPLVQWLHALAGGVAY